MEITKAVVVVGACHGSQAWPSLGIAARVLAPVANRPILLHQLAALAAAGVREAVLVADEATGAAIRTAVRGASTAGLDACRIVEADPSQALVCAPVADFVGSDPFHLHHGDVVLCEPPAGFCQQFADGGLDGLALRPARVAPCRGRRDVGSLIGCIVGPELHRALRRRPAALRPAGLEGAFEALRAAGARIAVRDVDACLPCRGGVSGLIDANRRVLEQLVPACPGERLFGAQVQGRVDVHPSAELRSSLIRGPAVIGPHARISDAFVGPYTSIGAGVQIDGVEIEHSIVLDGAEIRYLGTRIEGSLVGPRARIARDFGMPRAVRLSVGAGAEVALD